MRNLIYSQLRPVRDTALRSRPALRSYTTTTAAAADDDDDDDDDDDAAIDAVPTSAAIDPPVMHRIQMHFNGPFVMSGRITIS